MSSSKTFGSTFKWLSLLLVACCFIWSDSSYITVSNALPAFSSSAPSKQKKVIVRRRVIRKRVKSPLKTSKPADAIKTYPSYPLPTDPQPTYALPTPTPYPTSPALPSGITPKDISNEMVGLVNGERSKGGVSSLKVESHCVQSCLRHALDMAQSQRMDHTGSDGSTPADRLSATGYTWGFVAENIAAGQTSISDVMQAWVNSPGHYANIMSQSAQDFGAAVAQGNDQKYYWVQCFAKPL